MIWIILTIIAAIILFIALGVTDDGWKINVKHIFTVLALLLLIPGVFTRIPANHVGIKFNAVNGTSEITLSEGFHKKSPLDKVYKISTEIQTVTVANLTTQTKDAQYVNSTLDIKYKVNETNAYLVFKQFRTLKTMSENLISPTAQRVLELVTTKYNVIDILGEKRSEIYSELEKELREELEQYGITFISATISDMDAGEAIEAAITAEAVAKKAVETAEYELQKAETEAKQKSVIAQAEQDAAKIKAETMLIEAEAQRAANELLNQSLSELVLKKLWIEKWNGEMPMYYGGDADLMFNMLTAE